MSAYSNQNDINYFYTVVQDIADSLSEVSPNTAKSYKEQAIAKEKTPFEILVRLSKKMSNAMRTRTTLP